LRPSRKKAICYDQWHQASAALRVGLRPARTSAPIAYPKPDGTIGLDRMSSVYLANTNQDEDEPVHLLVRNEALQRQSEHNVFAGPSARLLSGRVYEWVVTDSGPKFVINAQYCIHCKTCDIKDPNQNITWVHPQGGEGPIYGNM
jgi:electron-transferring-flavoprotein dehydrogenase